MTARKGLLMMEVREFYNYLDVHEGITDKRTKKYEEQRRKAQKKK